MKRIAMIAAAAAGLMTATLAYAQAPALGPMPAPPPALLYGPNITLEEALQVVAAANAEAAKRKLTATIAIVDTGGALIYFQKATNSAAVAETFAVKKAISSVRNRRPSSYEAARLAAGVATALYVPDAYPFAGGVPIVKDGKVIGAIGETGGADEDVARAGAAAIR